MCYFLFLYFRSEIPIYALSFNIFCFLSSSKHILFSLIILREFFCEQKKRMSISLAVERMTVTRFLIPDS